MVTDAITTDPSADHSVKNLASRASLSTRQLTRLFQSELGMTPARYVELVRIEFARAALESGRNATEAARLAGFGLRKRCDEYSSAISASPQKRTGIDSARRVPENNGAAGN